ncbi:MAG: Lrp/AsnC family transcriptional regulator [Rhodocyclaceae bacterium]|nr:Lrp/AsnC family transcriptional regulator [Rhodocyclaceae bacterium]MCL4758573.1 Lrp/AsnC family transcriptional regulator [Rhodocyclaceae bacterium]
MDKFDQGILDALREDARQPVAAIAERVNLSRSAVADRIRKLEDHGVIRGYQVLLREPGAGEVCAYLELCYNDIQCKDMARILRTIPEVKLCHGISGETDMLLYVRADSMARIHAIRDRIGAVPGVARIKTHVVMAEYINAFADS